MLRGCMGRIMFSGTKRAFASMQRSFTCALEAQKQPNKEVGDVIEVNAGDRVPAGCLMIEEMNVLVDQ